MIQYIGDSLDNFPGPANQTWCFVHTINLIAKSILKPFDTWKTKDLQAFDDVTDALCDLAEGHNLEQVAGDDEKDKEDKEEEEEEEEYEDKNKDNELSTGLEPIWLMLLKVCLCSIDPNPNS